MSYRPSTATTGYFFSAYRNVAFSSNVPNSLIPFTNGNNVSISGGRVSTSGRSVYVVGEVQADSASGVLLSDIKINENTGSKSKGSQTYNNAAGTVCMDDAAYGINSGSSTSLYVADIRVTGDVVASESFKTRMMGVYTL
jgi:hypothetical protein